MSTPPEQTTYTANPPGFFLSSPFFPTASHPTAISPFRCSRDPFLTVYISKKKEEKCLFVFIIQRSWTFSTQRCNISIPMALHDWWDTWILISLQALFLPCHNLCLEGGGEELHMRREKWGKNVRNVCGTDAPQNLCWQSGTTFPLFPKWSTLIPCAMASHVRLPWVNNWKWPRHE